MYSRFCLKQNKKGVLRGEVYGSYAIQEYALNKTKKGVVRGEGYGSYAIQGYALNKTKWGSKGPGLWEVRIRTGI